MFKKKLVEQPLGYWEEKSYMMAIPKNEEEDILRIALNSFSLSKDIALIDNKLDIDKNIVNLKIEYEDKIYDVGILVGGISVPEYYISSYLFSDEERQALKSAKKALTIFMDYNEDLKKCYLLQLKLAKIMVPDLIGLLDESAEKMIPQKCVQMMVESSVIPSAKNLFVVQAIYDDKSEKIWFHTHGLCRCGITELEILDSDKEHQFSHYNLLLSYGMFLIENKNIDPRISGTYIGQMANGEPIVVTCRSWIESLDEYKKISIGNIKDRAYAHNSKTSVVFLYTSEENEKNGVISKLSLYDETLKDNPLFFFSDEETARMKALAMENYKYLESSTKDPKNSVMIKIGLPLKEKGNFEHIWFELQEIKGNKFRAKLTQEPYYYKNMHEGDEDWYTVNNITDWIIYTEEFSITPDTAFLLDEK